MAHRSLIIKIIFLSLFLHSCSTLSSLRSAKKPELTMEDVRVTGMNFSQIQLTFDVLVKNPNRFSLDLNAYTYELDIAGKNMIRGNGDSGLLIPADSSVQVPLAVDLSYSSLFEMINRYRTSESAEYNFRSSFSLDVPLLGTIELPVEKTGEIPLISRPRLRLTSLRIEDLSFRKADLSMGIQLTNPNSFDLNVSDLDFLIDMDGITALKGSNSGFSIPAEQSTEVRLPIHISFTDLGMAVYRTLTGSSVIDVRFESTALIDATIEGFSSSVLEFTDRSGLELKRDAN